MTQALALGGYGVRRRKLLVALALIGLAVLVGGATLGWLTWSDRITAANAARITPGMSLASVNQLLGRQGQVLSESLPGATGENHYVWHGARGVIHVAFRGDVTATDPAQFKASDGPLARLYNWLGW
jgi:hypothetical protein